MERLKEDTAEAKEYEDRVRELLGEALTAEDDAAALQELAELESAHADKEAARLPEVPKVGKIEIKAKVKFDMKEDARLSENPKVGPSVPRGLCTVSQEFAGGSCLPGMPGWRILCFGCASIAMPTNILLVWCLHMCPDVYIMWALVGVIGAMNFLLSSRLGHFQWAGTYAPILGLCHPNLLALADNVFFHLSLLKSQCHWCTSAKFSEICVSEDILCGISGGAGGARGARAHAGREGGAGGAACSAQDKAGAHAAAERERSGKAPEREGDGGAACSMMWTLFLL